MDAEDRWAWLARGRRDLADLLETLTREQWESPSLCTGWRVRDVAAHVAMTPTEPSTVAIVTGMVRARGHLWDFGRDVAIAYAEARTPEEIVNVLRRDAEARTMPALTNAKNLLMDAYVHAQDVALPLGLDHPVPTEPGVAGFDRVWSMGWPFWARRRLRGLRLVATDAPVDVGAGPVVEGPLVGLLLLVTGRTEAARARLSGPGVASLAA
jgi:uncharacterized protein (TIGR03083 family)